MTGLGLAPVYGSFQRLIGRSDAGETLVRRYLRPKEGERVLDLGCGVGSILEWLPKVDYWGMDLSQRYIRFAEKRFGDRAHFICADLCRTPWPLQGRFDRAIAIGLLHHLSDEQAAIVLENVKKVLKPLGKLITLDGCYEKGQSPIARLLLSMDRGKYVRTRPGYAALAGSVFKNVDYHVEKNLLRLPYQHLIMEMTVS